MTTYSKSVATDFNNSLDESQLHEEIVAASSITATLNGVTRTGDSVDIIFSTSLNASEQSALDSVISSHTPSTIIENGIMHTYTPKTEHVNTDEYKKILTIGYMGASNVGEIRSIKCVTYMHENITSYSVRAYDRTNNQIMAEATFTNTDFEINDMGTISNIPSKNALIEIQVKRNGGQKSNKVYIDEVSYFL